MLPTFNFDDPDSIKKSAEDEKRNQDSEDIDKFK